jgi:hypothetical protein
MKIERLIYLWFYCIVVPKKVDNTGFKKCVLRPTFRGSFTSSCYAALLSCTINSHDRKGDIGSQLGTLDLHKIYSNPGARQSADNLSPVVLLGASRTDLPFLMYCRRDLSSKVLQERISIKKRLDGKQRSFNRRIAGYNDRWLGK